MNLITLNQAANRVAWIGVPSTLAVTSSASVATSLASFQGKWVRFQAKTGAIYLAFGISTLSDPTTSYPYIPTDAYEDVYIPNDGTCTHFKAIAGASVTLIYCAVG